MATLKEWVSSSALAVSATTVEKTDEISNAAQTKVTSIPSLGMILDLIYKDNYGRLNMIGRERANRALIGCDSQ